MLSLQLYVSVLPLSLDFPTSPSCLSALSHTVTDVSSFPCKSNWRTPFLPFGSPQSLTQV